MLDRLDALLAGQEDLRYGQAAIYRRVGEANREALEDILDAVREERMARGEMARTLDAIRRGLKHALAAGPSGDAEWDRALTTANGAVQSKLGLRQKLELALPILPGFLAYKVELGAGSELDLNALWDDLKCRFQREKSPRRTRTRAHTPNPFTDVVAIRDPARFVGREGVLGRLTRVLDGGSVALVGERKIGKSSLLHRLADRLQRETGQTVIFWDFFDPVDVTRLLAKAIRGLGSDGATWEDFKRAVHGRRVVLLLDEFDVAPKRGFDLDVLRGCRALCQAERGLRLATASRVLPKEIFPDPGAGSWPYDFLSVQHLDPFTPDEAQRLLAHPWAAEALHFDTPTCDELSALSACHPYRLQRAAHHRYETLCDPAHDWRAGYDLEIEALE